MSAIFCQKIPGAQFLLFHLYFWYFGTLTEFSRVKEAACLLWETEVKAFAQNTFTLKTRWTPHSITNHLKVQQRVSYRAPYTLMHIQISTLFCSDATWPCSHAWICRYFTLFLSLTVVLKPYPPIFGQGVHPVCIAAEEKSPQKSTFKIMTKGYIRLKAILC